ncbi:MAG: Do family serine endopeptidase [Chitinivibrionales bacterium]|nr:Do family serine endopeptidase [Chitinivibrionales bacterium]
MFSRKMHVYSVLVIVASLAAIFLFDCTCSYAESNNSPKKGSVQFGAKEKPDIPKLAREAQAFGTIFSNVAEAVLPSVVSVIPTKIDTVVFRKNPFYRFFDSPEPFEFFQDNGNVEKRERRRKGLGSGVIVSKDGYILTNYHVVAGADEIEVRFHDKRSFDAEIIGSDSLSDVAVLKINKEIDDYPAAYLGDSDELRPGDWVVAIGNPFSLSWTVTAGIVSALGRSVSGSERYENYVQTDAAINPGNSGGAMVNIRGEVVGINTMIFTRSGGYMGIGFAIPINMARRVAEDLIYEGKVTRGWIGVSIQPLDEASREAMGIKNVHGVLIGDVFEGQPADKAGMERGDIVVAINDKEVTTPNELRNMVAQLEPGEKVDFEIIREGKRKTITITITERNEEMLKQARPSSKKQPSEWGKESKEKLGISVTDLSSELRNKHNIKQDVKGVLVLNVQSSSEAYSKIQPGDVIHAVKLRDQKMKTITNSKEYAKIVSKAEQGDAIMFSIVRDGSRLFIAFKVR